MWLDKSKHFTSDEGKHKVLRLHYETQFIGEAIFRCDVISMIGNRQVPIIKGLMCHPPRFVSVDVPIRQDQLNLSADGGEAVSEI